MPVLHGLTEGMMSWGIEQAELTERVWALGIGHWALA